MTHSDYKSDLFATEHLGKYFYHFQTIDSTQTYIKKLLLSDDIQDGSVVLADYQTSGKGTQGRIWVNLPKPQLMFSVLLHIRIPPQKLPVINILSAVIMAEVIEELNIHPEIKWPNDIYIDRKKVAGMLSELVIQNGQPYIILGIGLNTDAKITDFPSELQEKVTSLSIQGLAIDRFSILEKFLIKLEKVLFSKMSVDQVIGHTQKKFESLWMYRNQKIEIIQDEKILTGKATEIDVNGALLLHTAEGIKKIINGAILTNG